MLTVLLKEREVRGSTWYWWEHRHAELGVQSKVCRERAQSEGCRERGTERSERYRTEPGMMRRGAGTAAMLLMITKPWKSMLWKTERKLLFVLCALCICNTWSADQMCIMQIMAKIFPLLTSPYAKTKEVQKLNLYSHQCGDSPAGFTAGGGKVILEKTRKKLGSAWFYCSWGWTKTSKGWNRSFYFSLFKHSTIFEKGFR